MTGRTRSVGGSPVPAGAVRPNWSCSAAGHALHHGTNSLEMGGVGRQGNVQRIAGAGCERTPETLVVLYVPRTLDAGRVQVALELPEEFLVALAYDIYEHIEPAPVGHAHHGVAVTYNRQRRPTGRRGGG